MNENYDSRTNFRDFLPQLLHLFFARLSGPYEVMKRANERNYLSVIKDRKKKRQLFHINMWSTCNQGPIQNVDQTTSPLKSQ